MYILFGGRRKEKGREDREVQTSKMKRKTKEKSILIIIACFFPFLSFSFDLHLTNSWQLSFVLRRENFFFGTIKVKEDEGEKREEGKRLDERDRISIYVEERRLFSNKKNKQTKPNKNCW